MEVRIPDNEIKQEVIEAYHEVLRKINGNEMETEQGEIIELSSIENKAVDLVKYESPDELVKNLSELKMNISKSLDGFKKQLLPQYEKLQTIQQAISLSETELEQIYSIKVNANTLSAMLIAQKEKKEQFEKEINERLLAFENDKMFYEKQRQQEERDYLLKRDNERQFEKEQQQMATRELEQSLAEKRHAFEEECDMREARLNAREQEHQQLKEREAWILAREQEFEELKSKASSFPEELRLKLQKNEESIINQLSRKHEYDLKLLQIEIEGERKMYQQKISALEQQIEQYKNLKQLFSEFGGQVSK